MKNYKQEMLYGYAAVQQICRQRPSRSNSLTSVAARESDEGDWELINYEGPFRTRRRLVRNGVTFSADSTKCDFASSPFVPSLPLHLAPEPPRRSTRWSEFDTAFSKGDLIVTLPGDIIEYQASAEQV